MRGPQAAFFAGCGLLYCKNVVFQKDLLYNGDCWYAIGTECVHEIIEEVTNKEQNNALHSLYKNQEEKGQGIMRKQILECLGVAIFVFICASCTSTGNPTEQVEHVPQMQLDYTVDGDSYSKAILSGTSSWSYDNGDGTFTGGEADAPHPLDAVGHMVEINRTADLAELKVSFSLAPNSYTVRCWEDSYIGNTQAYEDHYTIVEIVDDMICLPMDEQGFIYEVHAIWQQGNASYAFYVTPMQAS